MTRLAIPRPVRRAQRSIRERLPNFRVHRSGILAFLGVLGPGLIAGLAGNDAGGIATYSVLGAETGFRERRGQPLRQRGGVAVAF